MDTPIFEATIILHLAVQIASQFAAPGQYAFPQMPGQIPGMHMPMLQAGQMPMVAHHPMPLNAPFAIHQQRMPLVVMPYHSKTADRKYKRRKSKKKYYKESSSGSSSSESSSSSNEYLRSKRQKYRRKQKRQVLTPVISYVTRNGDVVFQKKVKKESAKDWLEMGRKKSNRDLDSRESDDSQEMTVGDLKQKFNLKKRRKHKH